MRKVANTICILILSFLLQECDNTKELCVLNNTLIKTTDDFVTVTVPINMTNDVDCYLTNNLNNLTNTSCMYFVSKLNNKSNTFNTSFLKPNNETKIILDDLYLCASYV